MVPCLGHNTQLECECGQQWHSLKNTGNGMSSKSIVVLKVGGDLATQPELIVSVCTEISELTAAGYSVVLVHGGGPQLDKALKGQGRSSTRVAGRRVTSSSDLELGAGLAGEHM